MTVITPDKNELEKEKLLIEKKQREDDERAKYLKSLRESRKFQKYVVKEIFEAILEDVYSIDKIPFSDESQKVGELTIQFKLARAGFKKAIDKLK